FPGSPFDCRRDDWFKRGVGAGPVEIAAHFDLAADADNHARSKGGDGIYRTCRGVEFAIDLALVENVRAGDIKDGLLGVRLPDREAKQQKHKELERPGRFHAQQGNRFHDSVACRKTRRVCPATKSFSWPFGNSFVFSAMNMVCELRLASAKGCTAQRSRG